jgi:hypothetical protein
MSYQAEMSTDGKNYATNALRFRTKEEANIYAKDLMNRWLSVVDFRTGNSTDPVNYAVIENKLVCLKH